MTQKRKYFKIKKILQEIFTLSYTQEFSFFVSSDIYFCLRIIQYFHSHISVKIKNRIQGTEIRKYKTKK